MARAVFMLACESVAHDSMTGRMSFFHTIDGLEVGMGVPPGAPADAKFEEMASAFGVSFFVVAVWMRGEGEENAWYEWEAWHRAPDGYEGKRATGKIQFTAHYQRLISQLNLHPRFKATDGVLTVHSRIRKVEDNGPPGEWIEQNYPMLWTVKLNEVDAANPAGQPSGPTKAE